MNRISRSEVLHPRGSARSARPRATTALALGLAVLAIALPLALRVRREDKVVQRDAGGVLAAAGARRVLADDSRAAFYAGAEALHLQHALPDPRDRRSAGAIAAVASRERADAVVLALDEPGAAEVAARLAALLGLEATRVERPGATPVVVLLPPRRSP